jgi:hypothetical protein
MKSISLLIAVLLSTTALNNTARAEDGLTVNVAEIGIGKFHRMDNSVHPYADDNIWKPYVLANDASMATPQTIQNKNGSFTIFFSNLDELMGAMEKLSANQHAKIKNLNMNAHGMPGHMWYPKDAKTQSGFGCMQWRQSASAEDQSNYDQYYSPISKSEIMQMRELSNHSSVGMGVTCVTGLKEWSDLAPKHNLKSLFTTDAQIHFMSCIVGLGTMGDEFTKGIAALLLSGDSARVQASLMFGLGDWSMPEGMGFWDYQNDTQLDHDNATYPKDRSDREQMQKGSVRTAGLLNGNVASSIMTGRDFMFNDGRDPGTLSTSSLEMAPMISTGPLPKSIRIPGTTVHATVFKQ